MTRYAIVTNARDTDQLERYLPSNYRVLRASPDGIYIGGEDVAGWTLEDYVIPRLASGLIYAAEVDLGLPGCDNERLFEAWLQEAQ